MTQKASPSPAYTQRSLELRTAEYYASIRKPENEWKSIIDLRPQLLEFEHRIQAEDYENASRVLMPIDYDHLNLWGHYAHIVQMRRQLVGHLCDPMTESYNFGNLALAYQFLGQFEKAIALFEKALSLISKSAYPRWWSIWLGDLGFIYHHLGQFDRAIAYYQEALETDRQIGNDVELNRHLGLLGLAYRNLGKTEQAVTLYQEALAIARQLDDQRSECQLLGNLGQIYCDLGQYAQATADCNAALSLARTCGDRRRQGIWLGHLARICCDQGLFEQALGLYEDALVIIQEIGERFGESYCRIELSRTLLHIKLPAQARAECEIALQLDIYGASYWAITIFGVTSLYQGKRESDIFTEAITACKTIVGQTPQLFDAHYALALALVGQAICDPRWFDNAQRAGLLAPALAEYRRALDITAAPGVVRDALRDLELIRAAGIEGLEPAFALLVQAVADWQPLSDDALPSPTSSQEDTL